MSRNRLDRRVRRTRTRLKEALLELLDETSYEAITIRDLTDRADVGRSTFYSHYDSKEDLLFSGFDDWLLSLPVAEPVGGPGSESADDPDRVRFSLPLLRHVRSQRRFFDAVMVRGSSARVRRKLTELLAEAVGLELDRIERIDGSGAASGPGPSPSREGRAHALAGAFIGLASWWLSSGGDASAEGVDRIFQRIVRG